MALTGMAQLVEHRPTRQKRVTGSIPSQGTGLGCSWSLVGVCARGNQLFDVSLAHQCFSPSPSLTFSLKINKS